MRSRIPVVPKSLMDFVVRAYAKHDKAHDQNHVYHVFYNAIKIVQQENIQMTEQEQKEFPFVMLCHDVLDHKMKDTLDPDEVYEFYESQLGSESASKIAYIHNNCSWSKRLESVPLTSGDWMRLVLQDADWLEAIGAVGLQRCIDYTNANAPTNENTGAHIRAAVCKHINEKLLLIADNLNFASSKKMAADLNKPLLKYLKE